MIRHLQSEATRDIIVIGASLGGVDALSQLVAGLPPSLPAAILVVQHTAPSSPGLLHRILADRGPLPAVVATDGMRAERGRIHVAPPDRHMLLTQGGICVRFGPRENRSRPAIDPLFRTAAVHHRSRVIGVVLTGLLFDGAAGLLAVERCGGVAVVQAPAGAEHPEMPMRALEVLENPRQATLAELPDLLARLAAESAPPAPPVPELHRIEARLTESAMNNDDWLELPGHSTDFTCPDCHGALRETEGDGLPRYRCRVGHAFGEEALRAAKDGAAEEALWLALQTLQERVQMLERMAENDRTRGRTVSDLDARLVEAKAQVERLRDFVLRLVG